VLTFLSFAGISTSRVLFALFHPLRTPFGRFEGLGKVLSFMDDPAILELHNADRLDNRGLVFDDLLGSPRSESLRQKTCKSRTQRTRQHGEQPANPRDSCVVRPLNQRQASASCLHQREAECRAHDSHQRSHNRCYEHQDQPLSRPGRKTIFIFRDLHKLIGGNLRPG